MKVILYDDVSKVGVAGEVREVSGGFARNFLIPKKLAFPATPSNLKRWESEKKIRQVKLSHDLEKAQSAAKQIEEFSLTLTVRAGREGHLFGSVTSQMIAAALLEKGISIDKKNIFLESPIKSLGEFRVSVRLHSQVTADLKLSIVSAISEPAQTGSSVEKSLNS